MSIYDDTAVGHVRKMFDNVDENQPGDVVKGAKVIVDVLTGTGVAKGMEPPRRLVLGSDIVKTIEGKIEEAKSMLEVWGDIAKSTDHE